MVPTSRHSQRSMVAWQSAPGSAAHLGYGVSPQHSETCYNRRTNLLPGKVLIWYFITQLIRIKTKQRSYEWCGSFATTAITAVQDFWNSEPQYESSENRANYVEWAIPAEDEEPSPFTWSSVDETNDDEIVKISLIFALLHSDTNNMKYY